MEQIKYLLVGQSAFDSESYDPMYMEKDVYPFEVAAFIPKVGKDDKGENKIDLFEITTYRRIMGFLFNKDFKKCQFNNCELIKNGGEELVEYFAEKGIYFCNIDELNKNFNKSNNIESNKLIHENWEINETTKIILFGSKAINKYNSPVKIPVIYMPHPSHANNNKIWKSFDGKTNFVNYSTCEEIKNVTKEILETSKE